MATLANIVIWRALVFFAVATDAEAALHDKRVLPNLCDALLTSAASAETNPVMRVRATLTRDQGAFITVGLSIAASSADGSMSVLKCWRARSHKDLFHSTDVLWSLLLFHDVDILIFDIVVDHASCVFVPTRGASVFEFNIRIIVLHAAAGRLGSGGQLPQLLPFLLRCNVRLHEEESRVIALSFGILEFVTFITAKAVLDCALVRFCPRSQ